MVGTLRFVLALLVVINHVWLPTANKVGAHAVTGFYIISGYLMTTILNQTYLGYRGLGRYFLNRLLRIFPLYWVALSVTFFFMLLIPGTFLNIHSAIKLPSDAALWVQNLTLVGLVDAPIRIVPPAWSLNIECFFYIAMGLLLSRHRAIAAMWFVASLGFTIYLVVVGASFGTRYSTFGASSLFFSIGAVLYFWRENFAGWRVRLAAWWSLLAFFCVFPLLVELFGGDLRMLGYYGSTVLFLPLFVVALNVRRSSGMDRWLGDLSYPIFLLHLFCLGLVRIVTARLGVPPDSTVEAMLVVMVSIGTAALVVHHFEPIIERVRNAVRPARFRAKAPSKTRSARSDGLIRVGLCRIA